MDELAVLAIVSERLERAGFAHMLTGSMALNLYATPRMTRDVDVVVALEPEDTDRFCALFRPDFYVDEGAVASAARRRSVFNVIETEHAVKVDIIVRGDHPHRREELARRRWVTIEGRPLPVVCAEDLVLAKLGWARESASEMQMRDVRSLIAAVPSLDWTYLERWASDLGVAELLAQVKP